MTATGRTASCWRHRLSLRPVTARAAICSTCHAPWHGGSTSMSCTLTASHATSTSRTTSSGCWVTWGRASVTLSSRATWPPPENRNQLRKGMANDVLSPPPCAVGRSRRATPVALPRDGVGGMRGPRGPDCARRTTLCRRSWHARELLKEGVYPADEAVSGRLPLLHVRAPPPRRHPPLPRSRSGTGHRPQRRGGRLQGGAVYPWRPARAALHGRARRAPAVGRSVHLGIPRAVGGAGAERDEPTAPPQCGGDGRGLACAPAQGLGLAGPHARNRGRAALSQRRSALRF